MPAPLVLGEFDANRYYPHNVSFALDPDQRPVVSVNQLTASATMAPSANTSSEWTLNTSLVLFEAVDTALYTIDSSTPYLWLPGTVYSRFEEAFGLTYNDALQLYLLDNTQKEMLESANITFTFELADLPGSFRSVSINVTYKAFDLSLSYNYPGLSTVFPKVSSTSPKIPYFPLRKAANATQYTIGRAFLQENYLIVDYDRDNFSIYQAKLSTGVIDNQTIVNIYPFDLNISSPTNSTSMALDTIIWVGVAVGGVLGILIITALLSYCILKRQRKRQGNEYIPPKNNYLRLFQKAVVRDELEATEAGSSRFQQPVEVCGQDCMKEMATKIHKAIEIPTPPTNSDEYPVQNFERTLGP